MFNDMRADHRVEGIVFERQFLDPGRRIFDAFDARGIVYDEIDAGVPDALPVRGANSLQENACPTTHIADRGAHCVGNNFEDASFRIVGPFMHARVLAIEGFIFVGSKKWGPFAEGCQTSDMVAPDDLGQASKDGGVAGDRGQNVLHHEADSIGGLPNSFQRLHLFLTPRFCDRRATSWDAFRRGSRAG